VEPDTYSFGSTIVSTFQVGRFFNGGASNIGWATSTDGGATWTNGFLPGITKLARGPYDRASDPSVAFDAKHGVWMISSLAIITGGSPPGPIRTNVVVSRSTDGGLTWEGPRMVRRGGPHSFLDKNWTACDNHPSSPFYGNCYTEFDDAGSGDLILMSTSSDGGLHWGPPRTTADQGHGLGGQPVVQPNGTVVVSILGFPSFFRAAIQAFVSTDGGQTWGKTVGISVPRTFTERAQIRNPDLPSSEVDGSGRVYVVWYDCRFEPGCSANDIVLSTSNDGVHWSPVRRVPTDPIGSGVDHFTPGIGVSSDRPTRSANIGLTYYYLPDANCTNATCLLDVGFITSRDGGATWTHHQKLAGPMNVGWLPFTTQGYMYGDYISTSLRPDTVAFPVFAVANPPRHQPAPRRVAMYTVAGGLGTATGGELSAGGLGSPGGLAAVPSAQFPRTAN